jgi:hypothetical protein
MKTPDHETVLADAYAAVIAAQEVRAFHRKRTRPGEKHRTLDVQNALKRLKLAMTPIRSALGRAPYDEINKASRLRHAQLRRVSKSIQVERRKLWKLRGGKISRIGRPT